MSLTISGGGPEADNLKFLTKELGLENAVRFPGWVQRAELYRLMNKADLFILPRWVLEYSSVLLMEAMMCGLPVVVPAGGGLEWIAGDGGITFRDDDVEDLAKIFESIIENPGILPSLAKKSYIRSRDFSYEALGEKFAQIIIAAGSKKSLAE